MALADGSRGYAGSPTVPKGHSLGATHWTRRLQDTVERTNEPELGEMN